MSVGPRSSVFVSAEALAIELSGARAPVLLDVRNQNGAPDGRPEYLEGHLPGAVYVDLPTELQGERRPGSGAAPLPDIGDLERDARRWGIRQGDRVVVYDNVAGTKAGRAWFVLRWAGIEDVRLLDGGYAAWLVADLPTSREVHEVPLGDVALSGGHLDTIEAAEAADLAEKGALYDARGRSQFAGDLSGPTPRGGHVPGAIAAPTTENLDSDGLLLDESALLAHLKELGIDGSRTIGLYCGSGIAAAHEFAVLTSVGVPARLYVGSFSEWSADPSRPVAFGG